MISMVVMDVWGAIDQSYEVNAWGVIDRRYEDTWWLVDIVVTTTTTTMKGSGMCGDDGRWSVVMWR
jgi:hypothetical protein